MGMKHPLLHGARSQNRPGLLHRIVKPDQIGVASRKAAREQAESEHEFCTLAHLT